jgi:hypothetical protein
MLRATNESGPNASFFHDDQRNRSHFSTSAKLPKHAPFQRDFSLRADGGYWNVVPAMSAGAWLSDCRDR